MVDFIIFMWSKHTGKKKKRLKRECLENADFQLEVKVNTKKNQLEDKFFI